MINYLGETIYNRSLFGPPNTLAEFQQASGKIFRQYQMRELFDLQIGLNIDWGYLLEPDKYKRVSKGRWWRFWE